MIQTWVKHTTHLNIYIHIQHTATTSYSNPSTHVNRRHPTDSLCSGELCKVCEEAQSAIKKHNFTTNGLTIDWFQNLYSMFCYEPSWLQRRHFFFFLKKLKKELQKHDILLFHNAVGSTDHEFLKSKSKFDHEVHNKNSRQWLKVMAKPAPHSQQIPK